MILPKYFGAHRALASSLSLTGLGVGMVVAPILITYLIEQYSWRGAILIQAGIVANKIPLALTFVDPPRRSSMKTRQVESERDIYKPSRNEGKEIELSKLASDANDQLLEKSEKSVSLKEKTGRSSGLSQFLKTAFNFSMLRDPLFLLYCLSNILTRVNSTTIITHMMSFCVTQGFTLDQAALVASVAGGCNVAGRFAAGFMSSYARLNHLAVYGVIMLGNAASTLLLLPLPGLPGKCVAAAIYGFAFGKCTFSLKAF